MNLRVWVLLSLFIFLFGPSNVASAHDVPVHLDPELLTGWRTWVHLTIQWLHLVAFALWLNLTTGTLLLGMKPTLDRLLYGSWILFLLLLATGAYNMEWSAGVSETPSLFLLPFLWAIPYGVTYTLVLAIKIALYGLSVLLTLVITVLHVRDAVDESRLRKIFLVIGSSLAIPTALFAAILLFYHEAADLWPTTLHSLGGVIGPEGPRSQVPADREVVLPNDFAMLATRDAWVDIGLRWLHLLGYGLWLGGGAWVLCFGGVSASRYLLFSWSLLAIQLVSGMASMGRWTPFYVRPYIWNLSELSSVRFGKSYTLFMAAKHLLVIATLMLLIVWTIRYWRSERVEQLSVAPLAAVSLLVALAIGYIMMIVLLLHEGVDHAL